MAKCGACIWWNGRGCMNWNRIPMGKEIHDTCDFSVSVVDKKSRMNKGFPPGFGTFEQRGYFPPEDGQQQGEREKAERFFSRMGGGFSTTFKMKFHEDDLKHIFKDNITI